MKIQINTPSQPRGSVLLVSLVTVAIILTSLASYLLMVSNESQAVNRSQGWNTCVPVMEAGVEEAMSQLHYCGGMTSLTSNNWTQGTDGNYHKTRTVGTDGSYCNVTISNVNPPVIYSEAYVPAAGSLNFNSSYTSNNFVKREVRVATQLPGSGGAGMKAKGTISLTSGYFDSYNSSLAAYNATNHGTNGIVMTDTNLAGAIALSGGNTHVYGLAVTGPSGTVTVSGGAGVGSPAWIAAQGSSGGLESGWTANDANYQFNDVSAPSFSSFLNSFTVSGGTNIAGATGTTSNYKVSTINISSSGSPLLVYGNTTIYCTQTGNNVVVVQGSGYIKLMPGASLNLYTAGNVVISGSGIVNGSGIPSNLHIYGLPTCTQVQYTGSAQFYGVVDVPEAAFTYSGSADAFGDFTAYSINISGGASVHADQAVGNSGLYVVSAWNEIAPQ